MNNFVFSRSYSIYKLVRSGDGSCGVDIEDEGTDCELDIF